MITTYYIIIIQYLFPIVNKFIKKLPLNKNFIEWYISITSAGKKRNATPIC